MKHGGIATEETYGQYLAQVGIQPITLSSMQAGWSVFSTYNSCILLLRMAGVTTGPLVQRFLVL